MCREERDVFMSSRLDRLGNLEERALQAHYRVDALAEECAVTPRHLNRYVHAKHGMPAHVWLKNLQFQPAKPSLTRGKLVKQVAAEVGSSNSGNFSRAFKRLNGISPSLFG